MFFWVPQNRLKRLIQPTSLYFLLAYIPKRGLAPPPPKHWPTSACGHSSKDLRSHVTGTILCSCRKFCSTSAQTTRRRTALCFPHDSTAPFRGYRDLFPSRRHRSGRGWDGQKVSKWKCAQVRFRQGPHRCLCQAPGESRTG